MGRRRRRPEGSGGRERVGESPRAVVGRWWAGPRVTVGSPVESPGRRGDGRPLSRRRWRGGRAPAPVSSARSCRTGFRGGSGRGRGYRASRGSPWKTCAQGDRGRERVEKRCRVRRRGCGGPGVESLSSRRDAGGWPGPSRAGGGGAAGGRWRRSRSRRPRLAGVGLTGVLRGSPRKTCAQGVGVASGWESRRGRQRGCGGPGVESPGCRREGRPFPCRWWRRGGRPRASEPVSSAPSRRGGAYRALRGSPWKTCARCQSTKSRSGRNSFSCGGRSGRPRASTSWRKTSP